MHIMAAWIDGSMIAEDDPLSADPALDIYNTAHGPPFSTALVAAVRVAQNARVGRITARTRARLRYLRGLSDGPRDEAFLVYRTMADPRIIDLSLDPNDRPRESIWGEPKAINYGANNVGRFTTLNSWLSQWSPASRADGPACLARTTVPVLNLEFSADSAVMPGDIKLWSEAAGTREVYRKIAGATHYMDGQPEHLAQVVEFIAKWARGR